jgi:D-alanine-D-alanine ligase
MDSLSIGVLMATRSDFGKAAASERGIRPSDGELARAPDGALDGPSGADVLASLTELGHRARPIHVYDDVALMLTGIEFDLCILALHGTLGGTGELQALLSACGIPYVGAEPSAVGLAFDKVRARQQLAYHNLPVPTSLTLGPDVDIGDRDVGLLGWPCVLKPRRSALGVGVSYLASRAEVDDAIEGALRVDDELVLERAVEGPEVQVVLVGKRVLGAMQVDRPLAVGDGRGCEMMCPPQLSRARLGGIKNLARRAVEVLGLDGGVTRVDMLLGDHENEIILEVEPVPPLHRDGVVARVARAAGMDHKNLVADLLRLADARASHEHRRDLEAHVVA